MKRKLLCGLLAISMFAFPVSAYAEDNSGRIAEIEKQIAELQEELATLKGEDSDEFTKTGKFFQMSITNAYTATELQSYGSNEYPEDGKIYLIIDLDAKNISNDDLYLNRFYFTSFVDGYAIDDSDGFFEDIDIMTGDIFAGKSLTGSMVYEVSPDWKEFEINYSEHRGDKLTFVITPDSQVFSN